MTARSVLSRLVCIAAALLLVAGCSSDNKVARKQGGCPRVLIVKDADHLIKFAGTGGRGVSNIRFAASIDDFNGTCEYDKKKSVDVALNITFVIERGAALHDDPVAFSYSVALPSYYPSDAAKRAFAIKVDMPANQRRIRYRDAIDLKIPLKKGLAGVDHEILLAIMLTPDELAYNRSALRQGR